MTRSVPTTIKTVLAVIVIAVLTVVGYRAASPQNLPTPANWSTGWTLRVQFPNALNLPDQAHVRLNGRNVGVVKKITLVDDHTEATLAITEPAQIPTNTNAELQQDTLLGDIYVSLVIPPAPAASRFSDGGVIPLTQTKPPIQIEDLMSSAASFLGSGSLPQLGNTFNRVDNSFPDDPKVTRKITSNLTATINAWADDTKSLDSLLRSVVSITDKVVAERSNIEQYISPESDTRWPVFVQAARVAEVYAKEGALFENLAPLTPKVRDLAVLFKQVVAPLLLLDRPVGATHPDNLTNLRNLVRDTIAPFFVKGPKVNITQIGAQRGTSVPVADQTDQVIRTLRMIGVVR